MVYHDAAAGRLTDLPELLLGGELLTLLAGVCQTDAPKILSDCISVFCTNNIHISMLQNQPIPYLQLASELNKNG